MGPEPRRAHLADEARVALRVAEAAHLVIEGRGPDVRVVGEPQPQIGDEGLERSGLELLRTPGARWPFR